MVRTSDPFPEFGDGRVDQGRVEELGTRGCLLLTVPHVSETDEDEKCRTNVQGGRTPLQVDPSTRSTGLSPVPPALPPRV